MAGGGMRQAGMLAAAGSYALDHHLERLGEDHVLAERLADGLADLPYLQVEPPQTNILFVDLVGPAKAKSTELLAHLRERGILATGLYRLRFVTHLDLHATGIDRTIAAIKAFFNAA